LAKGTTGELLLRCTPGAIHYFLRIVQRTIRWTEINPGVARELWRKGQRMIFVFWHGRMLMMPFFYRGYGIKILISHHSDGELIHRVMERFGYSSVRGSTRRGGRSAFLELVRAGREGWDILVTPDGPRGPRYVVQRGVVELARSTGYPILPVSYSTQHRIVCSSWDALIIPRPFTRGVFVWGRPLWVGADDGPAEREAARRTLEGDLRRLTGSADGYFR
jgi:lysophospholipid acyltransferase (LPLAT)-like uncharacterized protein